MGLGYVGLPLAIEMAKEGFQVTGMDLSKEKVDSINAGISYIPDLPNETVSSFVSGGKLRATQSLAAVRELDTMNICVPTPLRKNKDPELSYVIAAVEVIRTHIRPAQLIILESTTYPGTTREVVLPILEESGLRAGTDFFLAYSPERVDPGNATYGTRNIPKVVGGVTPRCAELAVLLLPAIHRKCNFGLINGLRGNGETVGEYFPEREYRARQRNGASLPQFRCQRLGSH